MDLKNAEIYENGVQLTLTNGQSGFIYFDENSGRIVKRRKINTISDVQHTGIWLGRNENGMAFILHNHYERGHAHLSSYDQYRKGQKVNWKDKECTNNWLTVIEIGLRNAISLKPYEVENYNCQTYTNEACDNSSHSEDVNKWIGYGLGALAIGALVTAFVNSD